MKKKGLSDVIATVLLVLLVMVLGVTVFSFSKDLFENQKQETEGLSFYYDAKIRDVRIFESGGLASAPGTDSILPVEIIEIAVERTDNEGKVVGIKFIFDEGGKSYSYDSYDPLNNAGVVKIYKIGNEDLGIEDFSKIKKVSISLLYGKGKPTKILDETQVGYS